MTWITLGEAVAQAIEEVAMKVWVSSKNWKRKGANLPKNVRIAKAKSKKKYAPVPSYEVTKK